MGIALIFLKDGEFHLEYSKAIEGGTNNQAELIAIIIALRMIKRPIHSLIIKSDSEYCIGCASLNWKRKKNIKLWNIFDKEYQRVSDLCPNITFVHVRGHQKNTSDDTKWNNRCDELAVKAYMV
jgi:ribonuclease HI